jgi:UDP-N-acetylmuramate--alanine ligase
MGIGGQGISAVAQMVREAQGEQIAISGCDMQASETTAALQQAGIAVQIGHSANHVHDIDRLIVVPAALVLNPDHPELAAARAQGVPIITWQEVLGELMRDKCLLSVSGVHGKGTTTAMLALMLLDAGLDPTCEIGAIVPRFGANYRLGKSQFFVNEADEYYHNFWHYHPRLAIVTSIEFEHPEYYADYKDYLSAFEHFVRGMDTDGDWPFPPTLILNADSPGCLQLRERLADWPGQIVTYAVETANVAAQFIAPVTFTAYGVHVVGETTFRVRSQCPEGFPADRPLSLQLPGVHNVQNALAALAAARVIDIDAQVIAQTLANFTGLRRRFEIRNREPITIDGRPMDAIIVDDYAHHPTAIEATLAAARERFPGRRLVAIYQPHMFSRTKTFFAQFLTAFDAADVVIIADIYPARERDTGLIAALKLVKAMQKRAHFVGGAAQVLYGGSVKETGALLRSVLRDGDVAVIMGAGDIYMISEQILGANSLHPHQGQDR